MRISASPLWALRRWASSSCGWAGRVALVVAAVVVGWCAVSAAGRLTHAPGMLLSLAGQGVAGVGLLWLVCTLARLDDRVRRLEDRAGDDATVRRFTR